MRDAMTEIPESRIGNVATNGSGINRKGNRPANGHRVLLVAIILVCTIRLAMDLSVLHDRSEPIELDDAYSYIVKSSELLHCPLQDCLALASLRQQDIFRPAAETDTTLARSRVRHRLFTIYHPLHSVLLLGLHATGMPWKAAYWTIWILCGLLVLTALGLLLNEFFGPWAAGISLIFLTLQKFPGPGLRTGVPSVFSQGLGVPPVLEDHA